MLLHCVQHHPNYDPNNPDFTMTVENIYGDKSIDRQLSESIQIYEVPNLELINNKLEYQQTTIPRAEISSE